MAGCRYADALAQFHNEEHLIKFEELLEAAIDLDKIPDEYLICASYDPGLQVHLLSVGVPFRCPGLVCMHRASECLSLMCHAALASRISCFANAPL